MKTIIKLYFLFLVSLSYGSDIEQYHRSMWRVKYFPPSHIFADLMGTGFFIAPDVFVTSLHTLFGSWDDFQDPQLSKIVLLQTYPQNYSELKVEKIMAVSVVHDLILLKTKQSVKDYLSVTTRTPVKTEKNFILGHNSEGRFKKISTEDVSGEDIYWSLQTDYSTIMMPGLSGSPVIDNKGKVIGVVKGHKNDKIFAVKSEYLNRLTKGREGTSCVAGNCIEMELERLQNTAQRGNEQAQYALALLHQESLKGSSKLFRQFERLEFVIKLDEYKKLIKQGDIDINRIRKLYQNSRTRRLKKFCRNLFDH